MLIPTILVIPPCLLFIRFFNEKSLVPFAFIWLLFYTIVILFAVLGMMWGEIEAQILFLSVIVRILLVPILIDGGVSWACYIKIK